MIDKKIKLRLAICISKGRWSELIYNTKENYEKYDNMSKDIDEEYRTTHIDFSKYKLMEMDTTEQNKVALYLFNLKNIRLNTLYLMPRLDYKQET